MFRFGARRLHRWVALSVGLFLLVWIGTGVIMLIPVEELRRWIPSNGLTEVGAGQERGAPGTDPVDAMLFRDARVPVAAAIEAVERERGGPVAVDAVRVDRLAGRVVFAVELSDGEVRLVDATSGAMVAVDAELAAVVARAAVGGGVGVIGSSLLDGRDYFYEGELPAFRVALDDPARSVVYVSAATGRIERIYTRWSRLHEVVIGLHTFKPIGWLAVSTGVQNWVLVLVSMVAVATVLSGFWLALPARLRRRSGARSAPSANPID